MSAAVRPHTSTVATADGETFQIVARDAGVSVTPAHGPSRFIPWSAVVALPHAWGVLCDGWLLCTCDAEQTARDKAADLRAGGAAVQVFAIPATVRHC